VQPLLGLVDQIHARPREGKQPRVGFVGVRRRVGAAAVHDGFGVLGSGGAGVAQVPQGFAQHGAHLVQWDVEGVDGGQAQAAGALVEDVGKRAGAGHRLAQRQLDPQVIAAGGVLGIVTGSV